MLRDEIIDVIGREYRTYTIGSEQGEFFYKTEFQAQGKDWDSIKIRNTDSKKESYYTDLDIRFEDKKRKLTVCVETKVDYKKDKKSLKKAQKQLAAYMQYETIYSGNKVIGILASTTSTEVKMYEDIVSDASLMDQKTIVSMKNLEDILFPTVVNKKEKVLDSTYKLNELLHGYGIKENIRGQFVGTCLLALKNNLDYMDKKGQPRSASSILADIKGILGELLENSIEKAKKLTLLDTNVLNDENVLKLSKDNLYEILNFVDTKILPFINDETTAGQDILNLFFTMFNKYVDKEDKNQAFTPDHITDFMCKITKIDYNSRVLDICCGSGSFLVRALVTERNSCQSLPNKEEQYEIINKSHIYGIEIAEKPFGLATTNMLIHGDGNTNVIQANCFDKKEWIQKTARPTVILMNPPYNAQQIVFPKEIEDKVVVELNKKGNPKIDKKTGTVKKVKILKPYSSGAWPKKDGKPAKEDPTKGLSFVNYISDCLYDANLTNIKLAVLLPLQCAIGDKGIMLRTKENILEHNTLDAVFTLPPEMFHPGASANACCMLFTMGEPHCDKDGKPKKKTFFGYYKDDGFYKKKNLGRIEKINKSGESLWEKEIEPKWIRLFENGDVENGLSAKEYVTASDEWLCEAYMKTDYSTLTEEDFQQTLNNYLSYLIREGKIYES